MKNLRQFSLTRWPLRAQWFFLISLSLVLVILLEALHLPASLLLGPMVAAIIAAISDIRVRVPRIPFVLAQGLIGCMIAASVPLSSLGEVMADWPLFLGGVLFVIVASALIGWWLGARQILPGTTAIWGSSPGAAMAMTVLSEAYGADVRLVAFMQYLRVAMVVIATSAVAGLWGAHTPLHEFAWFPPIQWPALLSALAVALGGSLLAWRLRISGGALLLPMIGGFLVQTVLPLQLPPWVMVIGYALLGWTIGLRFTRAMVLYVLRILPKVAAAIAGLILVCAGFAAVLVRVGGIDPLTAYLATSPGGLDSVAIIAASCNVDLPFVMAMQALRFVLVMLTGPALARYLAARMRRHLKG